MLRCKGQYYLGKKGGGGTVKCLGVLIAPAANRPPPAVDCTLDVAIAPYNSRHEVTTRSLYVCNHQ